MILILSLLFLIPTPISPSQAIFTKPLEIIGVDNISGTETEFNIRVLSKLNNFDEEVAVRIAKCESQLGKYKTNWQGSSAKGVYMFIDKTWANYCDGDVMNDRDNINCFIKLYNKYPHWWLCS